jgi:hypothetical protein
VLSVRSQARVLGDSHWKQGATPRGGAAQKKRDAACRDGRAAGAYLCFTCARWKQGATLRSARRGVPPARGGAQTSPIFDPDGAWPSMFELSRLPLVSDAAKRSGLSAPPPPHRQTIIFGAHAPGCRAPPPVHTCARTGSKARRRVVRSAAQHDSVTRLVPGARRRADLSNFDPDGAWPSMFDDYAAFCGKV